MSKNSKTLDKRVQEQCKLMYAMRTRCMDNYDNAWFNHLLVEGARKASQFRLSKKKRFLYSSDHALKGMEDYFLSKMLGDASDEYHDIMKGMEEMND